MGVTRICNYYLQRQCLRGPTCYYDHPGESPPREGSLSPPATAPRKTDSARQPYSLFGGKQLRWSTRPRPHKYMGGPAREFLLAYLRDWTKIMVYEHERWPGWIAPRISRFLFEWRMYTAQTIVRIARVAYEAPLFYLQIVLNLR